MTDDRENYCRMLGLNPYKFKEYTEQNIKDAITRVEEEWDRELKLSTTTARQKYVISENLKALPDIRSTMDNPILREGEFEDAKKILERKASKLRRSAIILHDGSIVLPANAANKLAEKLKWKDLDSKAIITASGMKVSPSPRPINNAIHNTYRNLHDLCISTPQELVNRLIDIPDLDLDISKLDNNSSPNDLRNAVESVYRRLKNIKNGKIPNLDAYLQSVKMVKATIDSDEKLEELLNYSACMTVLAPAFDQMEDDSENQFSRAYIDNLFTEYVNDSTADKDLCLKLLEDYCIRRQFPANFSESETGLGICPHCKSMIYTGDNSYYCPSCGAAINNVCPCCGKAQTSANKFCIGCGIDMYGSLEKAHALHSEITNLIESGLAAKASEKLEELTKEYPQFEHIPLIKAKIHDYSDKIKLLVDRIYFDYTYQNFYDLKKAAEDAAIDISNILGRDDIRTRYDEACSRFEKADKFCVEAVGKDEATAKELYIKASEICPDHPDALGFLKNYPPEGPANAEIQTVDDLINIRYEIPEDGRGLKFCIFRSEGVPPTVDLDTKPFDETTGFTYIDKTAEPGIEYYYRIYSKRWGVMSQEYTECGPELIVREVTNVHIEPYNDGLKLTYIAPQGCSRVRIWRKCDDDQEEEIIHNDTGIAYDECLEGGTTYAYLFVAEYDTDGKTVRSYGNVYPGTTATLPQPINDLAVRWDSRKKCYIATWTGTKDATLYYSLSKDTVPGEHVSLKDLSTRMTRIEPLDSEDGDFRFELPDATVMYICPTETVGNTTIKGRECVIANLRPFSNLTKSIHGDECILRMDWPEDAEYASAVITGMGQNGEPETRDVSISASDYKAAGGFSIPMNGSLRSQVVISAVYVIEGSEQKSVGLVTEIASGKYSKVQYAVSKESVKGDRKKTRVVVKFNCPAETVIPRCIMVASETGIPLKAKDGKVLWESDDPIVLVDGRTECGFVIDKEEVSLENMRLFLTNTNDYNRYRFVHPLYRRD